MDSLKKAVDSTLFPGSSPDTTNVALPGGPPASTSVQSGQGTISDPRRVSDNTPSLMVGQQVGTEVPDSNENRPGAAKAYTGMGYGTSSTQGTATKGSSGGMQ